MAAAGLRFVCALFGILSFAALASSEPLPSQADSTAAIEWRCDYRAALQEAKTAQGMVLVWFVDAANSAQQEQLCSVLARCLTGSAAAKFVPVRLPIDVAAPAEAAVSEPTRRLLDHAAFAELQGGAGIAIIDMSDETSPDFHHVVSVYPLSHGPLSERQLTAMLELPSGSLTQRTLIWAVRTHDDAPKSASGEASPLLLEEAAAHSRYQSSIDYQGHHRWEERFHSINGRLPPDLVAQEVCAESWPGQDLISAARECVASWRKSSGHWEAVRTPHPQFGYDMQRGARGIWYATGIFARRR